MKKILSSMQFQNLLELFESSNSGGRCMYCGCPESFSIVNSKRKHLYSWDSHFAKCPKIKSLRENCNDETEGKNFRIVKGRAQFKDIVIDEVYECRWDCCTVSGRA